VIEVLDSDFGLHPQILPLNPSLRPDASSLKLRLRVGWEPDDPTQPLRALEERLSLACPGFSRHECRGPAEYHVRRFSRERSLPLLRPRAPVEGALALAHLVEHVMIDVVAFVARASSVSGVTGALARARATYDVFVECPDASTAALAAFLGPAWVASLLEGDALAPDGRSLLETARALNDRRPEARSAAEIARQLGRAPGSIEACLGVLEKAGYAYRDGLRSKRAAPDRYRVC
jgi:hypothetical protein